MNKKPLIGVFGGTFNPVHIGHLRVVIELKETLPFDHIRIIPCHIPAHRTEPAVSAAMRYQMVQYAIDQEPGLVADDCELNRPGPSYMVDTLRHLTEKYSHQGHLVLILGMDALIKLTAWHRWQDIFTMAHILVVARADQVTQAELEALDAPWLARLTDHVEPLEYQSCGYILKQTLTPYAISSSQVRSLLQNGQSVRYLIPDSVLSYINQQGLYGNTENRR